jgi:hypothetical protein
MQYTYQYHRKPGAEAEVARLIEQIDRDLLTLKVWKAQGRSTKEIADQIENAISLAEMLAPEPKEEDNGEVPMEVPQTVGRKSLLLGAARGIPGARGLYHRMVRLGND